MGRDAKGIAILPFFSGKKKQKNLRHVNFLTMSLHINLLSRPVKGLATCAKYMYVL